MPQLIEEKFNIESSDEELIETFGSWLRESKSYHDELIQIQNICEEYYKGNQTERDLIPNYLTDTVQNRIFEAIETLVPITTAAAHQFIVIPGSEQETSVRKAENVQKVLTEKYRKLDIQKKLEEATRHFLLFRFGIHKWGWDKENDDIEVKVIDPRLILIPKLKVDPHDLPYVMEIQDYSYNELEENFPKLDIDELGTVETAIETGKDKKEDRKIYRVFEVWTNEMVAWISGGKILDKKANPYYDFEGEKDKKDIRFFNHLDRPQKPYVFYTTFNISDAPVASVSLTEIGIPYQDAINVQKRQIIDNLRRMGNGQVLVDADAMSREEADNITNEVGLIIHGTDVASENKVRREPGTPLPASHFANLQHSEAAFDNLMGIHAATRGAAQARTLGQDILSRQQDFTRIDLVTRVLNRGIDRLANGLVQLMKMYYEDTHVIKILGEEGTIEFINFNRNNIEDFIEIVVKSGQPLPMDKIQLRNEAIQMWQLGALDPVTLYERLEFPNPEKSAERLISWKQGQLTMETQAKIQEAAAGTQARTAAKPEEGRGVETPQNVLQRARQQLGGTAPLTATPNL